jgi:hypothetical protein
MLATDTARCARERNLDLSAEVNIWFTFRSY